MPNKPQHDSKATSDWSASGDNFYYTGNDGRPRVYNGKTGKSRRVRIPLHMVPLTDYGRTHSGHIYLVVLTVIACMFASVSGTLAIFVLERKDYGEMLYAGIATFSSAVCALAILRIHVFWKTMWFAIGAAIVSVMCGLVVGSGLML